MTLPDLGDVDRTKAFSPEEQELVNALPSAERIAYMERPNSAETMTQEERDKHYKSQNYPQLRYSPGWTLTPPKSKR